MEENLITKESRQSSDMVYITSGSSPAQGSGQANNAFTVTPDDLVSIVNLYKERDEKVIYLLSNKKKFVDRNQCFNDNNGIRALDFNINRNIGDNNILA